MAEYDVSYLKVEENGDTHWVKVGKAFDSENLSKPGRIRIRLDSLPLDRCWDYSFVLFRKE